MAKIGVALRGACGREGRGSPVRRLKTAGRCKAACDSAAIMPPKSFLMQVKGTKRTWTADGLQRCDDACCKHFQCAACCGADAARKRAQRKSAHATSDIYSLLPASTRLPILSSTTAVPSSWSERMRLSKPPSAPPHVPPVARADGPPIPVLPVNTQVYVPPLSWTLPCGSGLRGHISGFTESTGLYTVVWAGGFDRSGAVPQNRVFRYIDTSDVECYPDAALPLDRRVRCGGDTKIDGTVEGVAVSHENDVLYYGVANDVNGVTFFPADQVIMLDHGLKGNFSERMAQVGQILMDVLADHAAKKAALPPSSPDAGQTRLASREVVVLDDSNGDAPSTSASYPPVIAPPLKHAPAAKASKPATAAKPQVTSAKPPPPAQATSAKPPPPATPVQATSAKPPPPATPVQATSAKPPPPATPVQATSAKPPPPAQATPSKGDGSSGSDSDSSSSSDSASSSSSESSPAVPPSKPPPAAKPAAGAKPAAKPAAVAKAAAKPSIPSRSDSDSSSSSERGESGGSPSRAKGGRADKRPKPSKHTKTHHDGAQHRKRGVKFNHKHDDAETKTIFMQLRSNVPWLHGRAGCKAQFKSHLQKLQEEGHALELEGHRDAVKTFSAWAANICKTRRASRLAEARKSGTAFISFDCVDDVAECWETKVCGEAALTVNNQERAILIRDVATSTALGLEEKAAKIESNRVARYSVKKKHSTDGSVGDSISATPTKGRKGSGSADTSPQLPQVDPKVILLRELANVVQGTADQESKDKAFVSDIVKQLLPAQAPPQNEPSSQAAGDVLLLQRFLGQEDSSLVAWAGAIYAALGITASEHFAELSAADVALACTAQKIPLLQQRRLLAVGKRFGMQ